MHLSAFYNQSHCALILTGYQRKLRLFSLSFYRIFIGFYYRHALYLIKVHITFYIFQLYHVPIFKSLQLCEKSSVSAAIVTCKNTIPLFPDSCCICDMSNPSGKLLLSCSLQNCVLVLHSTFNLSASYTYIPFTYFSNLSHVSPFSAYTRFYNRSFSSSNYFPDSQNCF